MDLDPKLGKVWKGHLVSTAAEETLRKTLTVRIANPQATVFPEQLP